MIMSSDSNKEVTHRCWVEYLGWLEGALFIVISHPNIASNILTYKWHPCIIFKHSNQNPQAQPKCNDGTW